MVSIGVHGSTCPSLIHGLDSTLSITIMLDIYTFDPAYREKKSFMMDEYLKSKQMPIYLDCDNKNYTLDG
jgi:hypothetical protein